MSKSSSYRRRSSFRNRLSLHSDDLSNLKDTDSTTYTEANASINTENTSSRDQEGELDKYIAKLKKEKNDWKALRKKLQIESRELEDKPVDVVNLREGWAFLTKEDKQFLSERPDYGALGQLLDTSSKAIGARQRHSDLVIDKAMNLLQDCTELTTEVAAELIHRTTHTPWELEQSEETCAELNDSSRDRFEQWCKLTEQEKARYFDLDFEVSDSDKD